MSVYERQKKYKQENPDKVRNGSLKRKYGITLIEWEKLFDTQDRKCAICQKDFTCGKNWHTDHDHVTGKIRGILCNLCNTALGKFKDNETTLQNAINYLRKSS